MFNLITKKRKSHKPTLESLEEALRVMRRIAEKEDIHKIAMPQIGCGLDRLKWVDVEKSIQEIFQDSDIDILVCIYPKKPRAVRAK